MSSFHLHNWWNVACCTIAFPYFLCPSFCKTLRAYRERRTTLLRQHVALTSLNFAIHYGYQQLLIFWVIEYKQLLITFNFFVELTYNIPGSPYGLEKLIGYSNYELFRVPCLWKTTALLVQARIQLVGAWLFRSILEADIYNRPSNYFRICGIKWKD